LHIDQLVIGDRHHGNTWRVGFQINHCQWPQEACIIHQRSARRHCLVRESGRARCYLHGQWTGCKLWFDGSRQNLEHQLPPIHGGSDPFLYRYRH